jgi:hypothetical protein
MVRQVRLVLIAAAIVVLLAIASVILLLNPLEIVQDRGVSIKAVEPVDVRSVRIVN